MCSMLGSLCLNGCADAKTEQTLESVEETQEEIAEAEGTNETKEAVGVQGESNNQSSEKVIEEKEETKKTLQIGISDSDYEYIFGLNSMPNIFGVNLEPEDDIRNSHSSTGEDGTKRYYEIGFVRKIDDDYHNDLSLRIALITDGDISWLKEYLKEGVYQEGSMVELPNNGMDIYELLKLEKREEIVTEYGGVEIVYFEGNFGWNGEDEEFVRKEIAYFNVNNHDGLVICNYTYDSEYQGKLSEVLLELFEPKQ